MFSKLASSNILNNVLGNRTLLSLCSTSIFSSLLNNNEEFNIITETIQPFIATMHDDPITFSQYSQEFFLKYQTNNLVFFHRESPKALKKEDKYILSKKISSTTKIFFSQNIQDSWNLQNDKYTFNIPYGVLTRYNDDHPNNICILNFNNNLIIDQLYKHIKEILPNCNIIKYADEYDELLKKISSYKIIISLDNIYDTIACAGCGCLVLTTHQIENKLPSIHMIKDYNNIVVQIKLLLESYNDHLIAISETQRFIENHYPITNFYESINHIFSSFKNRVYIHEA